MAIALKADLKAEGMTQEALFAVVSNLKDVVNELQADHATFRTVIADQTELLNAVRAYNAGNYLVSGDPAMEIDTDFDVKVANALVVKFGALLVTIDADTSCDTGTAATFPAGQWGIFRVSAAADGTLTATWAEVDEDAGFDTEEDAIAALPATPDGEVSLGYVTVNAAAEAEWLAGTDALETGSGGDPSAETNYYDETAVDLEDVLGEAVATEPPAALTNSTPITLVAG